MNTLSLKLKKLRKQKGLNQDELAQILGVGKTTISNYETGYTTPPSATFRQLASFFGVSVDDLLNEAVSADSLIDTPIPRQPAVAMHEDFVGFSGEKSIPVYASLSSGMSATPPIYQLKLPVSFVGEGSFIGLKVSGDKMDRAGLSDGSLAILRQQEYADDGEIVAISLDDNPVFISRFYRMGENIILISESSNPVYRPMVINPREQVVKIYGKVIKSIQSVF